MKFEFKKGDVIVFDGDSGTNRRRASDKWTWPFLQLMHWDKCWSDIMAQLLFCWRADLDLQFYNTAIGGQKSSDILRRVEMEILPLKPNWVLTTIGGNDSSVGIPMPQFADNIRAYCGKLDSIGAKVVFIHTKWAPRDMPRKKKMMPRRRKYFDTLKDIAGKTGNAAVLDISDGFRRRAEAIEEQHAGHCLASDGEHFNNIAATILAGEVLRAFRII